MKTRNRDSALALHMELLTKGSPTDDFSFWMSGLKQLIIRL